jgi:site-specific recombinase XerC
LIPTLPNRCECNSLKNDDPSLWEPIHSEPKEGASISVRKRNAAISHEDVKKLLESIPRDDLAGLRDRALISTMLFSFARISAVFSLKRQDFYYQGSRRWLRFHEKGGKEHEMPAHHEIEETIDEYLSRVSIDDKQPLFQSVNKAGTALSGRALNRHNAWAAIRKRAERGVSDTSRVSYLAGNWCDGLPGERRPARTCSADGRA